MKIIINLKLNSNKIQTDAFNMAGKFIKLKLQCKICQNFKQCKIMKIT